MKLAWTGITKLVAAENDREPKGYHEQQLQDLLERVREGFALLDAGRIDVFELDRLIMRYQHCARELAEFCGSGGSEPDRAARNVLSLSEQREQPDWWAAGAG